MAGTAPIGAVVRLLATAIEEGWDLSSMSGILPPRVKPEEVVEEIPANPPADPEAGRSPDRDRMLRYSG
jgi:hypothetical protein